MPSKELTANGFVLWRERDRVLSTIEVASALGRIVDIEALLPGSGVPVVQSLRPRETGTVGANQYSGNYGFADFPLQSDFAHWARPPHYFMLRCIEGAADVCTRVLPWAAILPSMSSSVMRRAIFAGRKRRRGCSGLVRALAHHEEGDVFRWDPIFLKPLNEAARALAAIMHDSKWSEAARNVSLCRPGDTILIDNWRTLHGRSPVPARSAGRLLERVYLSEVRL